MADSERRKVVLVTGAGGLVGTIMRQRLADRYEFRPLAHADRPNERVDIADMTAIRPFFDGIDVVVHLAAVSAVDATWEQVLPANLVGAYNVYEAAREARVGRVVFASTTHTVAMHEHDAAPDLYRLDDSRSFDESVELRPDSLYGASKAFGEVLGRYYSDRHGLSVICLRIGYVTRADDADFRAARDVPARDRTHAERARAIWLSQRDCAHLLDCAIDADPQLRWAVAYGTSDNPRQAWDLTSARRLLGYRPKDRAPE